MTGARERLVDALERAGCRPTSSGAARCPAHEDRSPSLSFRQGDTVEGVVVRCHAGCEPADIVAALGMTLPDLFDEPRAAGDAPRLGHRVVAEYVYTDEHGEVLYVVERRDPKDFRQRKPDGRGGWSWRLGDVRRVLYRLPEVLAAAAAGGTVYVVEGEKDADRLAALGHVATTNAGGAGKWRREYADALKGARVVVIADRDGVGREHAAQVATSLAGVAAVVELLEAVAGKDVSDHLAAGHSLDELAQVTSTVPAGPASAPPEPARRLKVTRASDITVRPVHWLWKDRLPLGTLGLLAGREGIGKSTVGYTLAADVTRGRLPGRYEGTARGVIVAATEDSWEHTIVPRLMAAGADLDRVYRVDVTTSEGVDTSLSLPRDLLAVEQLVVELDVALLLLDPLMSRLDGKLDTHKDAEVRIALEPLTALADRTGAGVLGLIHVNKGQGVDPLTLVMGSRAFTAVARAVLFVMTDPDDEALRLLGTPKNNLGRTDLPTLSFRIDSAHVADTDEGPVFTGRVRWLGESDRSITEALESAGEGDDARSAVAEGGAWLTDYLQMQGGSDDSATIKQQGAKAGHSPDALKRARKRLKLVITAEGFPRRTFWSLPETQPQSVQSSGCSPGETAPTAPTALTALTEPSVGAVGAVGAHPREAAPTDLPAVDCVCRFDLADDDHFDYCRYAQVAS